MVSGTVTSQYDYALEIRFVSEQRANRGSNSIVNNQYWIVLPDEINYTVMVFLTGSGSPIDDGVFQLYGRRESRLSWLTGYLQSQHFNALHLVFFLKFLCHRGDFLPSPSKRNRLDATIVAHFVVDISLHWA